MRSSGKCVVFTLPHNRSVEVWTGRNEASTFGTLLSLLTALVPLAPDGMPGKPSERAGEGLRAFLDAVDDGTYGPYLNALGHARPLRKGEKGRSITIDLGADGHVIVRWEFDHATPVHTTRDGFLAIAEALLVACDALGVADVKHALRKFSRKLPEGHIVNPDELPPAPEQWPAPSKAFATKGGSA